MAWALTLLLLLPLVPAADAMTLHFHEDTMVQAPAESPAWRPFPADAAGEVQATALEWEVLLDQPMRIRPHNSTYWTHFTEPRVTLATIPAPEAADGVCAYLYEVEVPAGSWSACVPPPHASVHGGNATRATRPAWHSLRWGRQHEFLDVAKGDLLRVRITIGGVAPSGGTFFVSGGDHRSFLTMEEADLPGAAAAAVNATASTPAPTPGPGATDGGDGARAQSSTEPGQAPARAAIGPPVLLLLVGLAAAAGHRARRFA